MPRPSPDDCAPGQCVAWSRASDSVRERLVTGPATTVSPLAGSLAGNCLTRVVGTGADVVVKHAAATALWRREARTLQAIAGTPGVAHYVAQDDDLQLLSMSHVTAAPRAWTPDDESAALLSLQRVHELRLTLPTLADRHPTSSACTVGATFLPHLAPDLHPHAARVPAAFRELRVGRHGLVPSHADAHPDNWILPVGAPVLIDFGNVCLAPVGYDEVFHMAFRPGDAVTRRDELTRAGIRDSTVAAVATYLLGFLAAAQHPGHGSLPWRSWGARHWPAVVSFGRSVLG